MRARAASVAGVFSVLALMSFVAGCGWSGPAKSRVADPVRGPSLQSLVDCLQRAGADTTDVTATRDLRVSEGELGVSFTSFHAYVGVAADRREAVAAVADLNQQIALVRQAGHGVVRGRAVYYFDAPLVPRAGSYLVEACVAGSDLRASAAMAALARALPLVRYPLRLERRVLTRCRALGGDTGCACVYNRAARLFSYGQIDGLGRAWPPRRALGVIAGLLGTCQRPMPVARL